jgi:NAD(P)-dependent dehydrogenase (short-subunit alcohol dehydrogenase family)
LVTGATSGIERTAALAFAQAGAAVVAAGRREREGGEIVHVIRQAGVSVPEQALHLGPGTSVAGICFQFWRTCFHQTEDPTYYVQFRTYFAHSDTELTEANQVIAKTAHVLNHLEVGLFWRLTCRSIGGKLRF